MANSVMKRTANIGTSFLILIFIVLCLAIFSVLSISNAVRENGFSEKNAAAVREYYRADGEGVAFLANISEGLKKAQGNNPDEIKDWMLKTYGDFYVEETNRFCTDVDMATGQSLRVEIEANWEEQICQVVAWNVYEKEITQIDQAIPVWNGQ